MTKPVAPHPSPKTPGQTRVDLSTPAADGELRLPHESDQAPDSQAAEQQQHQTAESKKAYSDAARGHPDTSLTPVLERADQVIQR